MNSDQLVNLTGAELAKLIATKELSPVEVVEGYLDRIDRISPQLNAYITVCREEALEAAPDHVGQLSDCVADVVVDPGRFRNRHHLGGKSVRL